MAEAQIGADFAVDQSSPPVGAMQASGPSMLHPLATMRAGTQCWSRLPPHYLNHEKLGRQVF